MVSQHLEYTVRTLLSKTRQYNLISHPSRFVLNIKGLPYKTEWVEYPNIESVAKKIGAAPTSKKSDGTGYYTLPIIYDPSTKSVISDSPLIALYLEKTYPPPSYPAIFPENTKALTVILPFALGPKVNTPLFDLIVLAAWKNLNEESRSYFRTTREADFGKKLEDFVPEGEEGVQKWKAAEEGYNWLNKWLDAAGGTFLTGDQIAYADIIVAGRLLWARIVLGKESKEWKTIAGWNGGRWGRFLQSFEKYEIVG